ncbi:Glycosyl phosphatidyl inositol protein transamidase complex subunit, partial [Serendipita sp. 399]
MSDKEIQSHSKRLQRRSRFINHIINRLYIIRVLLFLTGFGWLILLPWNGLSRRAYIDENALQPGHVSVDWNWGDVGTADTKLALLEDLWNRNASSLERATFIQSQFQEFGLAANTQSYTFGTPSENITGYNAYGVYRAQRTSGTEAIVIAASWVSRQHEGASGQPNLRGIATLLSLAKSLKRRSVWAKDLIFLVSDSYLDGAHAWLSAYHGDIQK